LEEPPDSPLAESLSKGNPSVRPRRLNGGIGPHDAGTDMKQRAWFLLAPALFFLARPGPTAPPGNAPLAG